MRQQMLRFLALLVICLQLCDSLPLDQAESLIVSSTTPSADQPNTKEGSVSQKPEIYEMTIDSNVTNRFATTRIISKVRNLASQAAETTFAVILPEKAYISGFVMEIDGKSYEAYVKEKEEAKQIYNQAVQRGQAAAHVEVSARDSNRFTVSINVAPESKATFKLTYEELLQRRNEQYEIVLNIHPGQLVKDLNVEVRVNETRPLRFIKAPPLRSGNEIDKNSDNLDPQAQIEQIDPKSAVVKFSPNQERQKQLAHDLGTKEEDGLAGQFIVTYDVERDPQGGEILVKDGYFVHFFAPSELEPLPKHVIFVLDTSGSMIGQRIKQLKEAMNKILSELKPEDVFNIVEFAYNAKTWDIDNLKVTYQSGSHSDWTYREVSTTPQPGTVLPPAYSANEANINKAKQVVEKLEANGGTDLLSGLELALKLVQNHKTTSQSSHQPLIIFLTDGEPTVGETQPNKIISKIQELNSGEIQSPIFALSFGSGADRDLLQKISLKNLGFARHIYEAADASLQLQDFYRQISSPLLSNVTFTYVSNVTQLTKTVFPIYFNGGEIVIAGRADIVDIGFYPCSIWGRGRKGPIELKPVVENSIGALERLWAYLTVKQILEEREAADNKTSYTKKALDIALKYSFVTPVTSLVVVKPNETVSANTENAEPDKPRFFPKYAQAGVPGPPGLSNFGARGAGHHYSASISGTRNYYRGGPPMPMPSFDSIPYRAVTAQQLTTQRPIIFTTTFSVDRLQNLKALFSWLASLVDERGFFSTSDGHQYKLGTDEVLKKTPCPKTPVNNTTAGTCTLLSECTQVHSLLTEAKIFLEHACYENNVAGICCPQIV